MASGRCAAHLEWAPVTFTLDNTMLRSVIAVLLLLGTLANAVAAGPPLAQKPLLAQIERLVDLLRDGKAVGYPNATMAQAIDLRAERQLVLSIFTVEGFGGGNNHSQYLAAFETDVDAKPPHYTLLDVIHIGGKGWRGIERLNARVSQPPKSGDTSIEIDALEVGPEDPPNFPSKRTIIRVALKDGRLVEIRPKR
jgi:hypothetical protein